ncbi:carbohydrate ABC transporter permease [Bifidobacterium miconisargentati]|uniref:carbohydrate ABC transporter permease n=1 Tax=Bifidobacterium miconisargentati TaxID=2834437 RepID=UPI001BDBB27B|nr:sugar ABC transporter permease [Bifidobacterium miconisargentati]MBW3090793.1 sugar ABC transporter permease [Bifidobacterium miconisargentati]
MTTTHVSKSAKPVKGTRTLERKNYPLRYVVPAGAMLLVFFFLPTVMNFIYAFTDWSAFKKTIDFNGLENLQQLFESGTLMADIKVTLIYAVLVAFFQNTFGLALAVLLEKDTPLNRFARTMFFIPVIMSALGAGYIWQAILKTDGVLNQIFGFFVGHTVDIQWLGSTTWTIVIVTIIHGWKWMGFAMLTYLAGLKTIDSEVLEAASIDGANAWQTFWQVKFPLIAPAMTFNVATALLGSMNSFDIVQATTNGGPGGSTEILNLFIWRTFGKGLYSQSTTMSLVLFVMVMVIAIPLVIYLRKREEKIL